MNSILESHKVSDFFEQVGFAMATVMCLAPQRQCAGIAVEMVLSMQREQPGFPDKHQAV